MRPLGARPVEEGHHGLPGGACGEGRRIGENLGTRVWREQSQGKARRFVGRRELEHATVDDARFLLLSAAEERVCQLDIRFHETHAIV